MLDNDAIIRFVLYAFVAISVIGFTFAYGFLLWARRQTPERRIRVAERMRGFSDRGVELFVRAAPVWVVVMSVGLLLALILASIYEMTRR